MYNISGCFYHYHQLALLRESVGVGTKNTFPHTPPTQVQQYGMLGRCSPNWAPSHSISTFCSVLPSCTETTTPGEGGSMCTVWKVYLYATLSYRESGSINWWGDIRHQTSSSGK